MKRLVRSNNRWLGGVCAGLAEYWSSDSAGLIEIDPTWIRLLWAIVTIVTGGVFGIAAYLAFWIIVPAK